MRLWTVQAAENAKTVFETGRYDAPWSRVPDFVRPQYDWIVRQMPTGPLEAPIWAWYGRRVGRPQCAPCADDLVALSAEELFLFPMVLLVLEVPNPLVLCSDYHDWCDFYFGDDVAPEACLELRPPRRRAESIQAVIPWIESRWVRRVVPLPHGLTQFVGGRRTLREAKASYQTWLGRQDSLADDR